MALSLFNTFELLEWILLDGAYRYKPPITDDTPIVIVEIDQQSLHALGEWPWGRDIHGQLAADLTTFGASKVVFDIFFPPEIDKTASIQTFLFSQVCMVTNAVYLSMNFNILELNPYGSHPVPDLPGHIKRFGMEFKPAPWTTLLPAAPMPLSEAVYNACKGAGHISIREDSDGIIRRVPLLLESSGSVIPQLALRAFMDYKNIVEVSAALKKQELTLKSSDGTSYTIPVDANTGYFINWCGDFNDTFYHCSYIDVLNAFAAYTRGEQPVINVLHKKRYSNVDAMDFFKNAVCLVGFTTAGLVDQKPVTVSNRYPLVGVHANIIQNILHQNYFHEVNPFVEWLIMAIMSLFLTNIVMRRSWKTSVFAVLFTALVLHIIVGWFFLSYTLWLKPVYIYISLFLSFIVGVTYRMTTESSATRQIKKIFKRYVAPEVVEAILQDPQAMALGGKRCEVSILFCDIRNFTAYADAHSPEEVINLLNTFFSLAVRTIFKYHGTIDKFIGDCVMAYWGAPSPMHDHAYYAALAAIDIQRQIAEFNEQCGDALKFEVGIGICSGEAIAGNIGLTERDFEKTEYTVIGDSVNLASRITTITPRNEIYISEYTYKLLNKRIPAENLPLTSVKGKHSPIKVYKILTDKLYH
ncbi:MAG: adenylate/guanylate cyclase domain-containing protein [Candidatus Auribacterota bacterium]